MFSGSHAFPSAYLPYWFPVLMHFQDSTAALALVSARPNPPSTSSTTGNAPTDPTAQNQENGAEAQDADLNRAKDLVELHYAVKEAHKRGELGHGLMEARRMVDGAVGQ